MMVAVAFPNSFSVPMTLLLAVGDHPTLLKNGQAGGEELRQRINTLFLLSYAIWVFARWSIGFPILSGAISFSSWLNKVLNPPVIACIIATVAGLVWNSWLHTIVNEDLVGTICTPAFVAIAYAGRCVIPVILMALGARLCDAVKDVWAAMVQCGYAQPDEADDADLAKVVGKPRDVELASASENSKMPSEPSGTIVANVNMPVVAYFALLVLRQVVGPAVGGVVACLVLRDIFGVIDNSVLLVCLLQSAGPPMINLSVMAGLSGGAETEVAKLLLLTYGFSLVSWTVAIAAYLWLLA